jgi:hypothetical protein
VEAGGRAVHAADDPVEDREQQNWERRPFARTFDLISAEYGWTDEQILDLTMERIAQVREVIWERRRIERHRDLVAREVELKTLASFIAAGPSKGGVKAAQKIRLRPDMHDEDGRVLRPLPKTSDVMRMLG